MSAASSRCLADAVLGVDASGQVGYVNLAVELATGRARRELLGRSLASVFGTLEGTTEKGACTLARRAMRDNCRVGPAGDFVLDQRGEVRNAVECWATPVHDRNGAVVGAILVFYRLSRMSRSSSRSRAGVDSTRGLLRVAVE